MKNTKIMISLILFLGLCLSMFSVNAAPTVENVTTEPAQPTPLSTIKVTATITGENITSVKITASECNYDTKQCYVNSGIIEMTLNDSYYEAELILQDSLGRTDHIEYLFLVTDNGIDYRLEEDTWITDLNLENGGTKPNNDNEGENDTAGFELIILLTAVFILLIFLKRKR
jgi:hypothetical protein